MMDKVTLNNEIVSFRPVIRQVKVHTISKLIRESKKLKSKNGTDQQKEKNHKKAERLTKEALLMKKLKEDDVSKFAVVNNRSPAKILADVSVPLEKKALARLSTHKVLTARVNKFRTKYPTWAQVVPSLLSELGAKYKKKKKNAKGKDVKERKKKITSHVPQNEGVLKDGILEKQDEISKSCDSSELENEMNPDQDFKTDENSNSDNSLASSSVKRIKNKSNNLGKSVERQNKNNKCTVIIDTGTTDKKSENTVAEIRRFADICNESNSSQCEQLKSGSDSETDLSAVKSEDPFFLMDGSDGECLNSVCSEEVNSNEKNKDFKSEQGTFREKSKFVHQFKKEPTREHKQFQYSTQVKNSRDNFSYEKFGEVTQNVSKKGNLNFKSFQHKPNVENRRLNRKERRLKEFQQKDNSRSNFSGNATMLKDKEGPIHPSWEAKRKLKEQQIMTFQGTKIKFDDD